MIDEQSLNEIITKGETTTVEFKSWIKADSMKERINLAVPELIAFANSKGGTVYFGVENNGDVTGCFGKYDLQIYVNLFMIRQDRRCLRILRN